MSVTSPQQPFYPPQPPPGYGPPYVQRPPKKKMSQGAIAAITVGSCLAAIALFFFGLPALAELGGGSGRQVRVVDCADGGSIVGAQAEVEVTNTSSRPHSYTVTVSFTDGGSTQYATGTASIRDVAPGQSGRGTATSWKGGSRGGGISECEITRVSQSAF